MMKHEPDHQQDRYHNKSPQQTIAFVLHAKSHQLSQNCCAKRTQNNFITRTEASLDIIKFNNCLTDDRKTTEATSREKNESNLRGRIFHNETHVARVRIRNDRRIKAF